MTLMPAPQDVSEYLLVRDANTKSHSSPQLARCPSKTSRAQTHHLSAPLALATTREASQVPLQLRLYGLGIP
jgi:hypothetical protein